jgi:hypothetical protein
MARTPTLTAGGQRDFAGMNRGPLIAASAKGKRQLGSFPVDAQVHVFIFDLLDCLDRLLAFLVKLSPAR